MSNQPPQDTPDRTSYTYLRRELYHGHAYAKGEMARLLIKHGYRKTVEAALKSKTRSTLAAARWALKLNAYEIEG